MICIESYQTECNTHFLYGVIAYDILYLPVIIVLE